MALSTQPKRPRKPVDAVEPPVVESQPDTPVISAPDPIISAPDPVPTTVHDTILSMDLTEYDLEGPTVHEGVPDPPKCVKRRLEANDCIWRWLSVPHVKKKGQRQYVAYSPTREDKIAIQKGDCPAGVHVSVDNRLCWGEDAFLGFLPRRFYEQRQAELAKLNQKHIRDSRRSDALDEMARRGGFKSPKIEVTADDRPWAGLRRGA